MMKIRNASICSMFVNNCARGERAYKHSKQGESSESSKNSQRPSGRTPKRSKARVARAARESRQRARTIAYALARPLRGLAGRFELGAFRSFF